MKTLNGIVFNPIPKGRLLPRDNTGEWPPVTVANCLTVSRKAETQHGAYHYERCRRK